MSKYANKTNEELLEDCLQSRSHEPWQEFVRRFQPLISGVVATVAYRCGADVSDSLVDDLSQDTYLKLCTDNCKLLRKFEMRHENALFGFLKAVAASVAYDHFRGTTALKRGGHLDVSDHDEAEELPASTLRQLSTVEENLLLNDIETVLYRITAGPTEERDRTVFWLYYHQGFTADAIASLPAIKLTAKGVASLLARLIILLKRELVKEEVPRFSAKDYETY